MINQSVASTVEVKYVLTIQLNATIINNDIFSEIAAT